MVIIIWFNAIIIKPLLADSRVNINDILEYSKELNQEFKKEWKYNIDEYSSVSFIPVVNTKWDLYAELPAETYSSNRKYLPGSNELESLTFIEDKDFFFRNLSFSLKGLWRAIYKIHFTWEKQGWSWITQQLVKNIVIKDNTSSIARKYKELIVSYYIDNNYSRLEIANSYLNRISYGKNINGIQKAWELYLWKENLSLEESFFINSMLKQPTYYYTNQNDLKERSKYYLREYLLSKWENEEYIQGSLMKIDELELKYKSHNKVNWENYYIRDKAKVISDKTEKESIKLNYDIDLGLEKIITGKIKEEQERICAEFDICDLWIVVINKTWTIEYLYGWEYEKSQVDSTSSYFELWSILKPFLYAQYFDTYGIQKNVNNNWVCISEYCPNNWNFSKWWYISFNRAINLSYNLPVIHIIKDNISIESFNNTLRELEIYDDNEELNASMVLWTKQSTLFKVTRWYLSLINGEYQSVDIFEGKEEKSKRVFKEESVSYIRETLRDNGFDENYSIKTWTTSNFKDHYIMWVNDEKAIGIWMWNKDGTKTKDGIYSITKWWSILKILLENL